MRNKAVFLGGGVIFILISVLNTAYAKPDLLLSIPPLLAASQSIDRIAGCYSGNFTDNCLGNNANGIIGVSINTDRSFSTVSIFGVKSSGKFTERIHNTYTGSGQTDAAGCGSYDITCTDLGYSLSCKYQYANGKTGVISNANSTQCMPANQFLTRSLAGSWTFTIQTTPPSSVNYYLNSNSTDSSYIHGYNDSGYPIRAAYSGDVFADTYTYRLYQDCYRYCPWFRFNYISTNNIEGQYCSTDPNHPTICYLFSGNRYSSTVSTLAAARAGHTATLLPDGRILAAGGYGDTKAARAELYYPAANTWSLAATLAMARSDHTATLLPDGRVLVAGGLYNGGSLASVELYNPANNTWFAAGTLAAGRSDHTATLLPDGRVLVAGGGSSSGYLNSAELYDPATNTWSAAGTLTAARAGHTATLLADSRVLVAGGYGYSSNDVLNSAELYELASNSWSAAGTLAAGRSDHTATPLSDGRVLITGGYSGAFLNSAELYDPATNTWSSACSLTVGRSDHTATLLPDGQVLITGGQGWIAFLAITELYDPASDSWSLAENFAAARVWNTATLLPDGGSWLRGGMAVRDTSTSLSAAIEDLALPKLDGPR